MWDITAETKALALAPVRHIWCRAIFGARSGNTWTNDRNYYGTDKIVSAVVDIGTKSGGIQVGNAFCGKLTLLLLDGVEIHQSDRIILRVGFYKADGSRSEDISLGWYYVDTVKKSNGIYTVTAYDKMLRAHKNYNSKLTYPAKMSAVLLELCDLLDVNLASDFAIPYDGTISEKPAKGTDSDGNTIYYTRREMLSYLASAMGGNFFFDAGGHLQLTRFATVEDSFAAANSIEADISDDSYSVNGIVWTLGGVTYSRNDEDTDGIMEFENPLTFYPKEPVQHAIEERVTGLNYHEATIRRQGCGWFELGDIATAYRADGTSAPVLITGLNYSIADGGFAEKIYSSARSSSQDNYTTGDIVGQSVPQSVGGAVQSSSGTGGVLTEYQYLTDTSVKFNGTTYTIEKDVTTGLISKISDSYNHEFKPSISPGITDVALHNAVFWALAMCRGLGEIPQKTLFDGTGGAWSYSGGLTGFRRIAGNQPYSGIDSEAYYTSGAKVLRLSKAYRLEDSEDNYTDAIIICSNEQINLSGYSKLRILAFAFTNYVGLDGKVYFEVGEPGAAVPGKAYDFSAWKLVGSCDGFSTNYSEPGTPKWYEVDVSALGGNQYLNFGVYHGSQVYAYTSYFDIHKIILIP